MVDPEYRTWNKRSFAKNGWWKLRSGRAMLAASRDKFSQYAAADAWGTLQAYIWYTESGVHTAPIDQSSPVVSKQHTPQPDQPRQLGVFDTSSESDEDTFMYTGPPSQWGTLI